ncbi:MAG: peptidoglycan-associated lipoprotein Pal [Myxococcota bacterium]
MVNTTMATALGLVAAMAMVGCKKKAPEPAAEPPPVVTAQPPPPEPPAEPVGELQTVYFDFDRANLRGDQIAVLEHNLDVLQADPRTRVVIEGHADERGTVDYNLALGQRRADAAAKWLTLNGMAPNRIDTISYGEERPVDRGHDERAWARNRRDEFRAVEPVAAR